MDTKYLIFDHEEKYWHMKTKKTKEEKSLITELRVIRDKISEEISGMTPEQVVDFFKEKKPCIQLRVGKNELKNNDIIL